MGLLEDNDVPGEPAKRAEDLLLPLRLPDPSRIPCGQLKGVRDAFGRYGHWLGWNGRTQLGRHEDWVEVIRSSRVSLSFT